MNYFLNKMKQDETWDEKDLTEDNWTVIKYDELKEVVEDMTIEKLLDFPHLGNCYILIEKDDGSFVMFDEFVESCSNYKNEYEFYWRMGKAYDDKLYVIEM